MDGKSRSRAARGWFRRDDRRALAFCLIFGVIAVVGLSTVFRNAPSSAVRTAAVAHAAHADDDLTTGSIIFVPILGNVCRKRLIDNATWQIRDNGIVDCRTALTQNTHGRRMGWSGARVDVIRHGFTNR